MLAKNLNRRLKRLEDLMPATDEYKQWQIIMIDSNGNRERGPGYQHPPIPIGGYRPTPSRRKARGR
jgi:hypothetical protein